MGLKKSRGGARPGSGRPSLSAEQRKSGIISVRLKAETLARLEAAAAAKGTNTADIIRELIERYLSILSDP